jgi:hypothetical protein
MNLLEINGDLPYHESSKSERGVGPESKKGGEFARTLRPFLLTALKKPSAKGPNCLTFSFKRSIQSENIPSTLFRQLWKLTVFPGKRKIFRLRRSK